jgi:PleD family two-component response regulator
VRNWCQAFAFHKCNLYRYIEADSKARVRILIAEDNLMNQKVVTKILHTIGFRSTVANNGGGPVQVESSLAIA